MYGKNKTKSPLEERDRRLQKAKEAKATKQRGYTEQFNGQQVKITLVNGEELTGTLQTDFYNKYDYLLEEEQLGIMAIRKDAVAYIRFKEVR